jgi:predicted RNase H-like HicB family nuclease
MEYAYPAVFHRNEDGSYTVTYPDLPGCISEGKSMENARYMAEAALAQWIGYLTDRNMDIPAASAPSNAAPAGSSVLVRVRVDRALTPMSSKQLVMGN